MARFLALISAVQWKKRSRAKRRRGGRGDLVAPEIPWDLQIEILSRLPAKSLMRFKCVSKRWSCLIRCRYFSNLCLTVASPLRPPRLYMSLLEQLHTYCLSNSMEACHKPGKSLLLSLSSSSSSSLYPDLTTMQGIGGDDIVVLRGLILFNVCRKACIYNPATRQSVTLPAVKSDIFARPESHWKHVIYFLGHDPVLDQYKVVCTVVTYSDDDFVEDFIKDLTSEHWVFLLEAGGSWKKVEFDQPNLPTRSGLCIDGVIYYLATTRTARHVVFSFDVRSEEFNMIVQAPLLGESVDYIEYGGKPTIFDHTHLPQNGLVDLWVLEDGGKWCKKSQFLQPCQMHLVEDHNIQELFIQCTTQSGEILLVPIPIPTPSYFLYYDLQKNNLRKVDVNGIWGHQGFDHMNHCCLMYMNKSENIMHLET